MRRTIRAPFAGLLFLLALTACGPDKSVTQDSTASATGSTASSASTDESANDQSSDRPSPSAKQHTGALPDVCKVIPKAKVASITGFVIDTESRGDTKEGQVCGYQYVGATAAPQPSTVPDREKDTTISILVTRNTHNAWSQLRTVRPDAKNGTTMTKTTVVGTTEAFVDNDGWYWMLLPDGLIVYITYQHGDIDNVQMSGPKLFDLARYAASVL